MITEFRILHRFCVRGHPLLPGGGDSKISHLEGFVWDQDLR